VSTPLITATGLTKILCKELQRSLWYGTTGIARELLGVSRQGATLRPGEFRALDDVSFEVAEGESLGLVGRNGAGKTTLLRVLSGLLPPDAGHVTVRGRVGALIALGAGFNPTLSGRENIYVNGAVLGFSGAEIAARFDEIVEFAELYDFIDAPLHSYSSGMHARLGFSVAAQLEPDILLVDEVLAVGDIAFRAKCYRRIHELLAGGTAVILVSHQATMLQSVCTSGLLLEKGRIAVAGEIEHVLRSYEARLEPDGTDELVTVRTQQSDDFTIDRVVFLGAEGTESDALQTGTAGAFRIRCTATRAFDQLAVHIVIRRTGGDGEPLVVLHSDRTGSRLSAAAGAFDLTFEMSALALRPGPYRMKVEITGPNHAPLGAMDAVPFRVTARTPIGSAQFFQSGHWRLI
jgi:lipopolysaccharide transport system ATP-binding protein